MEIPLVTFDDVHNKVNTDVINRIKSFIEWVCNDLQDQTKAAELDELFWVLETEVYNKTLLVITQKVGAEYEKEDDAP